MSSSIHYGRHSSLVTKCDETTDEKQHMSEIRLFDFTEIESDYESESDQMIEAKNRKRNKTYKADIAIVGTESQLFNQIENKCLTVNTNEGRVNCYFENDIENEDLQGVIITYNPDDDKLLSK